MPARSKIEDHPHRNAIDYALDHGETYSSIIARFGGTSTSALSRYAISRKGMLAQAVDAESSISSVVGRLVEAADDAQELRRQSRIAGTPVARVRAIKAEAEILSKLITELGISETTTAQHLAQVDLLVRALAEHAQTHPESARLLIETFRNHPQLSDLTAALAARLQK